MGFVQLFVWLYVALITSYVVTAAEKDGPKQRETKSNNGSLPLANIPLLITPQTNQSTATIFSTTPTVTPTTTTMSTTTTTEPSTSTITSESTTIPTNTNATATSISSGTSPTKTSNPTTLTHTSPRQEPTNTIKATTKPVKSKEMSSSRPTTAAPNGTQQNVNSVTATINGESLSTVGTVKVAPTAVPDTTTMSTTTEIPLKYSTMAFNEDNKTCPFGYSPDTTVHACVHLCEAKHCQNDGQCYVELDVNNATVSKCRCKETSKDVYTGDNCESSEMSRGRERGITLGVLITMNVLFFLLIFLMCVKLKRGGNKLRAAQKSYDVNNL